jgi:hypothetical protein
MTMKRDAKNAKTELNEKVWSGGRIESRSPREIKEHGKYLPHAEALKVVQAMGFTAGKPQSRERFTTERIGRRKIERKG